MESEIVCLNEFGRVFGLEIYLRGDKARDEKGRDTTFHVFKVEIAIADNELGRGASANRLQAEEAVRWKLTPRDAVEKISKKLAAVYDGKIVMEDVEGRKIKDNVVYIPGPVTPHTFSCHLLKKLKELAAGYGYDALHVKILDEKGFYAKSSAK